MNHLKWVYGHDEGELNDPYKDSSTVLWKTEINLDLETPSNEMGDDIFKVRGKVC